MCGMCDMSRLHSVQANGLTPLCVASQNGHADAVRALLGAGASVNQATVSAEMVDWCAWSTRSLCRVLMCM